MAQLDVRRTYADGFNLLKQDLDAFVNDIETFINLTGLNDDNFQDAGITGSTKLVDGSVTDAKFVSSSLLAGNLASNSIATSNLTDGVVNTASLDSAAVTSAKVASLAITAAKIPDGVVTDIKIASTKQSSGDADTVSTAYMYITNTSAAAQVSITTTSSRPVLVTLAPNSTNQMYIRAGSSTVAQSRSMQIIFGRTTSGITTYYRSQDFTYGNFAAAASTGTISFPNIMLIDESPGAGTHVYSIYIGNLSGSASSPVYIKGSLVAVEI